jgi:hypothetical protein
MNLLAILMGSLLIAIGIAWLVGAVRLLAGLVAVPIDHHRGVGGDVAGLALAWWRLRARQ